MFQRKEKKFAQFIQMISHLDAVEFLGVCKILKVPLIDEKGEDLPFDALLEGVLDGFLGMKKKPRKQLLEMLRQLEKEKMKDGTAA